MTKTEFNTLFNKLYNPLCNYANAIVKDDDLSEDIVQEVFVSFWNKQDELKIETKKIENYLIRSIKFKCIDVQRKEIVIRKHQQETLHTSNIFEEENESEIDYKTILYKAIEQLPKKTKEVFILSKLNGYSYNDIAQKLNISPKTVENQMGRAFKHIREILKNEKFFTLVIYFLIKSGGI